MQMSDYSEVKNIYFNDKYFSFSQNKCSFETSVQKQMF